MSTIDQLSALVARLWQRKFSNQRKAFESTDFRWLVKFCRDQYCGPGTASEVVANDSFDTDVQRNELERCFKWLGAPWYGGEYPDAKSVARSIHRGYTADHVETFTLLPLDLVEGLAPVEFGPWQIKEFSKAEFSSLIRIDGLKRFGPAFEPDVERLHRLSWLIL